MKKKFRVIGVVFLFMLSSVIPISIGSDVKILDFKGQSLNRGKILSVGGSGPNNYTKIQDAIDDASSGDTVFVYDDCSPYYEHIYVNKSIYLIGENKDTTIINGEYKSPNVISINANSITVKGFSITGSEKDFNNYAGIRMYPYTDNGNLIVEDNIIFDNDYGIYMYGKENYVTNNIITKNNHGILLGFGPDPSEENYCSNSTISNNTITYNDDGIILGMSEYNKIINNNISNNNINGIKTENIYTKNDYNIISDNNICHNNENGIYLQVSSNTDIFRNNLIKNRRNAFFMGPSDDIWYSNYWSDYVLKGLFPKIIIGRGVISFIPRFAFDWHPATEPYDI